MVFHLSAETLLGSRKRCIPTAFCTGGQRRNDLFEGRVNLRLYHTSPRLSEGIDFDARVVGVDILKKNVNKVLASRPLLPPPCITRRSQISGHISI
jgi:hypothetical protein